MIFSLFPTVTFLSLSRTCLYVTHHYRSLSAAEALTEWSMSSGDHATWEGHLLCQLRGPWKSRKESRGEAWTKSQHTRDQDVSLGESPGCVLKLRDSSDPPLFMFSALPTERLQTGQCYFQETQTEILNSFLPQWPPLSFGLAALYLSAFMFSVQFWSELALILRSRLRLN